jgi:hypothetical protein
VTFRSEPINRPNRHAEILYLACVLIICADTDNRDIGFSHGSTQTLQVNKPSISAAGHNRQILTGNRIDRWIVSWVTKVAVPIKKRQSVLAASLQRQRCTDEYAAIAAQHHNERFVDETTNPVR